MLSKIRSFLLQSSFYFSTWTGRILLVNFILFLLISISSGSIFAPESQVLIAWGAKDPVGIARGEWWRLIAPIFLHFGIIHFALNSLALKVVGAYLEPMVGAFWFLLIYLGSGIAGNVLSSYTNVSLGAGASGAIFGLIGLGVVVERIVMYKEREQFFKMGPFTYMTIINIAFAVVFNFISLLADGGRIGIDNSAHLGGLFGGMLLASAMLFIKRNRLLERNYLLGAGLILVFCGSLALGAYFPFFTPRIYEQLISEAEKNSELPRSYYYYTQALRINASDSKLRFKRGRALALLGEVHYAMEDLLYCARFGSLESDFEKLHEELIAMGHIEDAAAVKSILDRMTRHRL